MKLELDDKWKWAAMDYDGEWYFFTDKPNGGGAAWHKSSGEMTSKINRIISNLPSCPWQDSLHQIINGELVKHVELQVDDKVMVRGSGGDWPKRYFSSFDSTGKIVCFSEGSTSWSNAVASYTTTWDEWRLPTPEELA